MTRLTLNLPSMSSRVQVQLKENFLNIETIATSLADKFPWKLVCLTLLVKLLDKLSHVFRISCPTFAFNCFWSLKKNFLALCRKYFDRIAKTSFYVSIVAFRDKILSEKKFFPKIFRTSSEKIPASCQKRFSMVSKTAIYVSKGVFGAKIDLSKEII